MAAWNISEVILAEGLAEAGPEDPPASDLGIKLFITRMLAGQVETSTQLVQVQ